MVSSIEFDVIMFVIKVNQPSERKRSGISLWLIHVTQADHFAVDQAVFESLKQVCWSIIQTCLAIIALTLQLT